MQLVTCVVKVQGKAGGCCPFPYSAFPKLRQVLMEAQAWLAFPEQGSTRRPPEIEGIVHVQVGMARIRSRSVQQMLHAVQVNRPAKGKALYVTSTGEWDDSQLTGLCTCGPRRILHAKITELDIQTTR